MGANVGTTVTAWILSLAGIDSGNLFIQLLKPSSFTPVLSLIGIVFYMFCKDAKRKDTGMILLGFATLMFGMETMSGACPPPRRSRACPIKLMPNRNRLRPPIRVSTSNTYG